MNVLRALFLTVACLSFGAAMAEDKPKVGEKVSTPLGTVKVDKATNGSTTVRGTGRVSPSITVRSEAPTKERPAGETNATLGVTIETD